MKPNRRVFRVSLGVLCLIFLGSALFAFLDPSAQANEFKELSFPGYIPIPLAIAKLLGIVAVVTRKSRLLKDLAMAGFLFDMILATAALRDDRAVPAVVGLVVWGIVYWQDQLLYPVREVPVS